MELGQGDVPGVKGVRPPQQDGGLPCDVLKDAVPQQPNPQPAHVIELPLGILPSALFRSAKIASPAVRRNPLGFVDAVRLRGCTLDYRSNSADLFQRRGSWMGRPIPPVDIASHD